MFEPPSREFWLGTDGGGADMLDLLIAGARVSLLVGFAAAAISAIIGGTVGLLSGFFGGKTDTVLMRIDRLFPGDPGRPADHRDRRALRPQHVRTSS